MDKPIFVLEGFDPTNSVDLNQMLTNYNYLNQNEYCMHDLVLINYSNGGDNIFNNVQLLKGIIKFVNRIKKGNYEGMVVGESMGGIIARIALKQLENEGFNHQIGTYTSCHVLKKVYKFDDSPIVNLQF